MEKENDDESFDDLYKKSKMQIFTSRMQGFDTKNEIFLTQEDISKNTFEGVNRTLIEEQVASEKYSSDDEGDGLPTLSPEKKMTQFLEQNIRDEAAKLKKTLNYQKKEAPVRLRKNTTCEKINKTSAEDIEV